MRSLFTPLAVGAAALLLVACGGGDSPGASSTDRATPLALADAGSLDNARRVQVPEGTISGRVDSRLRSARGSIEVWVSLEQNSVAAQRAALAETAGVTDRRSVKSIAALRGGTSEHRQRIQASQASLASQLSALGGKELARVQTAHNAIAVRIDAAQLNQVAALQGVAKVRPVLHYELALSETVPYVGGAAVQATGRDGTGVRVAVLDSGIDYTHRNFGGAGTGPAYEAAYGVNPADARNTTTDGLFPTAKVVGGYDFVGETWGRDATGKEIGTRTEDPDPIDFQGHGSHVADIIGGRSADGTHKGMAPGAQLLAVKVCSAITTACNGIALIKAMDFALDPNGDGDTDDAVDVINLSLGSSYGQIQDDLSAAASNAVRLGVVVVAAAGNDANLPYIVSSPSIAPGVISVAQTAVPSDKAIPLVINPPSSIAGTYGNTQTIDWAPVGAGVTGNVVFVGRGCPAGSIAAGSPEDPYLATIPAGAIALIDRGACSVSLKVDRAVKAGAAGVLIGLVAAGDAVSFSNGGGTDFKPTLVIQQSLATAIKGRLAAGEAVNASISPDNAIALVGGMASTSARGPSFSLQTIKPEIGAPGASRSAIAGSGTEEEAFGGTSGATPMVAGAAALLIQAYPERSPLQIKAMLMNSAQTAVYTNPATLPGQLAPITRIGAGELRVNRAIALNTLAYDRATSSAALSFGALEVSAPMVVEKTLRVENLSNSERRFTVTPSFRFADDEARGAVRVQVKSTLRVGRRDREDLEVKLVIDPAKLAAWPMNGGSRGGRGDLLNGPEYDGYITLTAASGETLSIPWHVLPRKAAETSAELSERGNPGPSLKLRNRGAENGLFEVFSLAGVSKRIPRSDLPAPGDNFAVIDMRSVGVRYLKPAQTGLPWDVVEFAIHTEGRRAHPNFPAEFDIFIDANNDGNDDFAVFNGDSSTLTGGALTGQNLPIIVNLTTGAASAVFFTDADLNSGNVVMTVRASTVGIVEGTTFGFSVYALDNYFTGETTDAIEGMRFTPGQPRFGVVGDSSGEVASRATATLGVTTATLPDASSTELGLLMMYRSNAGKEAEAIRIR